MKTIIRGYISSAGILLLSMATALIVANLTVPALYVPCRDPLLNLKLPILLWILGGLWFVAGLLCLFGKRELLQLMMIGWLGTIAIVCWLALVWTNAPGGFTGYLGDMADAFGLSCTMANNMVCATIDYLLIGSILGLILIWIGRAALRRGRINELMPPKQIKLACVHCGGRIQFNAEWFGQTIPCPHCKTDITLKISIGN